MNILEQLTSFKHEVKRKTPNWKKALEIAHATHADKPRKLFEPLMKDQGWLSTRTLSERTGRDPRSVNLSLRKLIELGHVERVRNGHSEEAWRKKIWLYRWIDKSN